VGPRADLDDAEKRKITCSYGDLNSDQQIASRYTDFIIAMAFSLLIKIFIIVAILKCIFFVILFYRSIRCILMKLLLLLLLLL
jgi:hypothetical protein